jgi:hypothetical protein
MHNYVLDCQIKTGGGGKCPRSKLVVAENALDEMDL